MFSVFTTRFLEGKKRVVAAWVFLIGMVCAFACFHFAYKTGYVHCFLFSIDKTKAQEAFECGNYYFGVNDSGAYDVDKAEQYFGEAVRIDPKTPDAWHQYARIAFLRGDLSVALDRINMQFKERGDELMASYYIRGLIEGYALDYEKAEKDFTKFLEWSPNNWAGNNDLAWIYFSEGKFKEAAAQVDRLLKIVPNNPWLLVMHAMSIYNLGDTAGALSELERAKVAADLLTEANWARAYPGNDPRVAAQGLSEFKRAIEANIRLVHSGTKSP